MVRVTAVARVPHYEHKNGFNAPELDGSRTYLLRLLNTYKSMHSNVKISMYDLYMACIVIRTNYAPIFVLTI